MYELLSLLEKNARYSEEELAAMLEISSQEIRRFICEYEQQGVIRGYTAIVDWDKTSRERVSARIEVKVAPKKGLGFDEVAEQISQFEEVQSLYLMSGGYDLALTIVGKSFKEIASFVAYRLAPMDSVQSTATHFILRKYKEKGSVVTDGARDERRELH